MRCWLLCAVLASASAAAQDRPSQLTTEIRIAGEVQRELRMTVDDLRRLPPVEAKGYTGARLTGLLAKADIRQDQRHALRRTYVVATASDGFQAVFSWGELFNTAVGAQVLVAYARDGLPLRDGEGRIALVSLSDQRPGTRHVKWLRRIDVRRVPE